MPVSFKMVHHPCNHACQKHTASTADHRNQTLFIRPIDDEERHHDHKYCNKNCPEVNIEARENRRDEDDEYRQNRKDQGNDRIKTLFAAENQQK